MSENVSRETRGMNTFRVNAAIAADIRMRKLAELSQNWPDPTKKRQLADLKPIYVHNPETSRLVEAAKAEREAKFYPERVEG